MAVWWFVPTNHHTATLSSRPTNHHNIRPLFPPDLNFTVNTSVMFVPMLLLDAELEQYPMRVRRGTLSGARTI